MSNANDSLDVDNFQEQKLPTGLNVLTILTFIGSAFGALSAGWGFLNAKTSFDNKNKAIEQMNSGKMPAWAKSMMPDMTHFDEMVTKSYENRLPILLISLIAIGLCIAGAMQMRKRKKQGFMLYTIGELLPIPMYAFFIGTFILTGTGSLVGFGLSILFIILYATQRKYLTK